MMIFKEKCIELCVNLIPYLELKYTYLRYWASAFYLALDLDMALLNWNPEFLCNFFTRPQYVLCNH